MQRGIIAFLLSFSTLMCFAGQKEISFKIPEDWPDSPWQSVKAIAEDSRGFLWIGTETGVDRYDGFSLKSYPVGLQNPREDLVESVAEDGDGTIWIDTKIGLFFYDKNRDSLSSQYSHILLDFGMPADPSSIFVDADHNLWAVASDRLFCRVFNREETIVLDIKGLGSILGIAARSGLAIVLFDDGSFYRLDTMRDKLILEGKVKLSQYIWHYIYLDSYMNLWFYTAHSPEDGIRVYSLQNRSWKQNSIIESLSRTIITTLIEDDNGLIWIGTENEGFYILDFADNSLSHYQGETTDRKLPNNHVRRFCKTEGGVWMTLGNNWLVYAEISSAVSKKYPIGSFEDISTIFEDQNGNIWLGTDGDGLICISETGTTTRYCKSLGNSESDIITCSLVDSGGNIWIGTYANSILLFRDGRFESLDNWGLSGSLGSCINSIVEDSMGRIWVATNKDGIFYTRLGEERFYQDDGIQLKDNSYIKKLLTDSRGIIYIATADSIIVFDCLENTIIKKIPGDFLKRGEVLTTIYLDSNNRLWIGMRSGIAVYESNRSSLIRLDEECGIPSVAVSSIMEDKNGSIWVSSEHSLIRIRENLASMDFSFECIGLRDGVFKKDACLKTSKGESLFCSTRDVLSIDPDCLLPEDDRAIPLFTGLYLFDKLVSVGDDTGILKKDISQTNTLRLRHNQNSFMLTMSVMDANRNTRAQYEYRVNGFDDKWMPVQGNRIQMNALKAGKYILEARATDKWSWTSDPARMDITIMPSALKSKAAVMLYVILSMLLLFIWDKSRVKNKQLEQELEQQKELDEGKMRFFTNISHDLKTPLSMIISPLERMRSDYATDLRQNVDLAYKNALILKEEIERMLDVRILDAGCERINFSRGDFVSFVREVVSNYKNYIEDHGIGFSFNCLIDSLEMDFDKQKVQRILMNLISNSVKYNVEGGTIEITLSVSDDEKVFIEVADTGIGIKEEDRARIFSRFFQSDISSSRTGNGIGLHIVKEYVQLLHGSIAVAPNRPHGSRFTITLPIYNNVQESAIQKEEILSESDSFSGVSIQLRKKRILVVEDNDDLRFFLERCLRAEYDIVLSSNGKRAVGVLESQYVDLVISDVMMPEMDGLELCRQIKGNIAFSHIPIILLTAKNTEKDILEGLENGADEYISKPFNIEILLLRIKKILEWTDTNHRKIRKGNVLEPKEITVSSLDEQLITKAIRIVEENIDNSEFSVEDLSMEVGMTRGHLYKKLMFIMGVSPVQFIRIIRMKRGKSLMEQGWTNISEVAYAVGYSPKQFSHHFKQTFGVIPSAFLSQLCQERKNV